jgi:hypothetical protein
LAVAISVGAPSGEGAAVERAGAGPACALGGACEELGRAAVACAGAPASSAAAGAGALGADVAGVGGEALAGRDASDAAGSALACDVPGAVVAGVVARRSASPSASAPKTPA